jgi:hypothetical protein
VTFFTEALSALKKENFSLKSISSREMFQNNWCNATTSQSKRTAETSDQINR